MAVQPETALQNRIRLRISEEIPNCCMFRNSVGTFRTKDGSFVQAGLPPGSSDLIGILHHEGVGVFVALEVKLPGQKPRPDQVNFLNRIRDLGGIAGVVTSPEEAIALLT
jgi:hypothetical protein